MQTADFNYQDFNLSAQQKLDEQLMVKFFFKSREDKAATQAQGRPIFKELEYIEIRVPGKRDAQACRRATDMDKQRFPRHYEAFKNRTQEPETGTPLAEWPQINRSQVEMLAFLSIKTVEQLAAASDTNIGSQMGGYALKQRAADWLGTAGTTQLIASNASLKTQVKSLEAKVEMLLRQSTEIAPAPIDPKDIEPDAAQQEFPLTELDGAAEVEDETTEQKPPKATKRRNRK
jgi:hypothetical protein